MICRNCSVLNQDENDFCVNCGNPLRALGDTLQSIDSSGEVLTQTTSMPGNNPFNVSTETRVLPYSTPGANFQVQQPMAPQRGSSRFLPFVIAGVAFFGLVAGAALFFFLRNPANTESLPENLGMFIQTNGGGQVKEITKTDASDIVTARDRLLKDDSLPVVGGLPNFILHADGRDIPYEDLRLIRVDSVTDKGDLKYLPFQAAPIDGKPNMKRIRVQNAIADGRYAFALLGEFANDGNHKFWGFIVRDSGETDNSGLKSLNIPLKPKSSPPPATQQPAVQPVQRVPPPPGAREAFSTTNRLVLRAQPTQLSSKIGSLSQGERVWVLEYSNNVERFKEFNSNFAYVQTATGKRGWVYNAFLR